MGGTKEITGTVQDGVHYSALGDLDLPADIGWPDGPGVLVIRPESINILDNSRDPREHGVAATVTDIRVLGPRRLLTVAVSGTTLQAGAPWGRVLGIGDDIRVSIPVSARAVVTGGGGSAAPASVDRAPAVPARDRA